MPLIVLWIVFAAAVLIISLIAHLSTFIGVNPMQAVPGVMMIHLLIFPPFIAALVYMNREEKHSGASQAQVASRAPLWLRVMTGIFFAYAFVNFGLFVILSEGGGPHEQNGKYVLMDHGNVIRELSEPEYHQHRAYVVRGFSGHWMLFASAALMCLVGAANKRNVRHDTVLKPATPMNTDHSQPIVFQRPRLHVGILMLLIFIGCVVFILSDMPILGVICLAPMLISTVHAFQKRWGFPREAFQSGIGCLGAVPSFFLAVMCGNLVREFTYLVLFTGLGHAVRHDITIIYPEDGPYQLSNGEPLRTHVWPGLMIVQFFMVVIGTVGLTNLLEVFGTSLQKQTPRMAEASS